MATQGNDFDFDTFNKITDRKPAGLQLFLAIQLMSSVCWSLEKFDNPLATDAMGVLTELKLFRAAYKQAAADRAK